MATKTNTLTANAAKTLAVGTTSRSAFFIHWDAERGANSDAGIIQMLASESYVPYGAGQVEGDACKLFTNDPSVTIVGTTVNIVITPDDSDANDTTFRWDVYTKL